MLELTPDFTTCGINAAIIAEEVNWIMGYANQKEIEMTTTLIVGFIKDLPDTLLTPCEKGIPEQIQALEEWVDSLTSDVPALLATIAKNLALHSDVVSSTIADIKAKIEAEDFMTVGKDCAYLIEIVTGKVQPEQKENDSLETYMFMVPF